jgi:hypothetical protein
VYLVVKITTLHVKVLLHTFLIVYEILVRSGVQKRMGGGGLCVSDLQFFWDEKKFLADDKSTHNKKSLFSLEKFITKTQQYFGNVNTSSSHTTIHFRGRKYRGIICGS